MLTIEQVDTQSTSQVRRFVELPFRLYANCPQWVPPFAVETDLYFNRQGSFYEQVEMAFFIAVRDGQDVGRLAMLADTQFKQMKGTSEARFFFFDCEDDLQAATALFEQGVEWAQKRHLNRIIGPRSLTPLNGSGILLEGFSYRQVMNMSTYNHPYYARLVEAAGFEKADDYLTYHLDTQSHQLPAWLHKVADWICKKEKLHVHSFSTIEELRPWVAHLLGIYRGNQANNDQAKRRIASIFELFRMIADPKLIKAMMIGQEVAGFMLAFPNLSAALQRRQGRLELETLQQEIENTKEIVFNGFTILPQFQLQGVNALLFSEMEKMIRQANIQKIDIIQINETTTRLLHDLSAMGVQPTQKHRVYRRDL